MRGDLGRIVRLMKIASFLESPSLICGFRNVRILLLFHIERIAVVMTNTFGYHRGALE